MQKKLKNFYQRKSKIVKKENKNTAILTLSYCHGNGKNLECLLVFEMRVLEDMLCLSVIFNQQEIFIN